MKGIPRVRGVIGVVILCWLPAFGVSAQNTDPLVGRIQQMVNEGNRTGARAAADSALRVRTPGTAAYAEALYARAFATSDAAAAERDYVRVSIEYPFSPRAEESILMVGQFRMARGDRAGARAQFERLANEFPQSSQVGRASYWAGRLALDDGDLARGCAYLFRASEHVPSDDVELKNQVDYLRTRCAVPVAPPLATDTAKRDSVSGAPAAPPEDAKAAPEYSVQVAAFQRKRDADALASRLNRRGFQVRVVGARAPYRVRVGRYAERVDAVAAQQRMRRAGVTGVVVEAEPK
jgi:cell division septation protein DedD